MLVGRRGSLALIALSIVLYDSILGPALAHPSVGVAGCQLKSSITSGDLMGLKFSVPAKHRMKEPAGANTVGATGLMTLSGFGISQSTGSWRVLVERDSVPAGEGRGSLSAYVECVRMAERGSESCGYLWQQG